MAEDQESLSGIINSSGYLFQLRIKREVMQGRPGGGPMHGWNFTAEEHRWVDPANGEEGFIDLILDHGIQRVVIECKRVIDGQWLFLIPQREMGMGRARLCWSYKDPSSSRPFVEWSEFRLNPASPEASFCVVRGQGEKDKPMLERLCGILTRSVEALAIEETTFPRSYPSDIARIYIPVIVTNATLKVAYYDPDSVSLSDGQSPADKFNFQEVPYLRFRKNLSTSITPHSIPEGISHANREHMRTVLVINATHLVSVLRELEVMRFSAEGRWPWEQIPGKKVGF